MKNPIKPATGASKHVLQWLTTSFGEKAYINSKRQNDDTPFSDNDIAVLYIHGTADRACGGKNLVLKLRHTLPKEMRAFYLISFSNRFQKKGIDDFSKQLIEKMRSLRRTGIKKFILIGHSRGGLIAAHTAQSLSKPSINTFHIEMVITLSAPFNGSHLAMKEFQWMSKSIEQMNKGSSFLHELRTNIENEPACPYTFFSGTRDLIVHDKAKVRGYIEKNSGSEYKLSGHGHLSITSAKSTVTGITEVIKRNYGITEALSESEGSKLYGSVTSSSLTQ